jgi:hypothetical protein
MVGKPQMTVSHATALVTVQRVPMCLSRVRTS